MCEKLLQEYRIWADELLEVLYELCEDVVPAGRLEEDVYWRTKALYREQNRKEQSEFLAELLQYATEGRNLLKAVKAAIASAEDRTEETVIRLRRRNAAAILSSLQYLANFTWLAGQYVDIYQEFRRYFEMDVHDEVKHIRSGVVVNREKQIAKTYSFRSQRVESWSCNVAG